MKRAYLLGYKMQDFQGFDETTFIMDIEVVWLWGRFKTKEVQYVHVPHSSNLQKTFDKWDNMIKNRIKL